MPVTGTPTLLDNMPTCMNLFSKAQQRRPSPGGIAITVSLNVNLPAVWRRLLTAYDKFLGPDDHREQTTCRRIRPAGLHAERADTIIVSAKLHRYTKKGAEAAPFHEVLECVPVQKTRYKDATRLSA
jgi:hypothetical protein